MDWHADMVQGVLFTSPATPQRDALTLWPIAFPDSSPDGYQRTTNSPNLLSTATGERDGVSYTIQSQIGRVDIVASPVVNGIGIMPPSSSEPPRLHDFERVADIVAELLNLVAAGTSALRAAVVLDLARTVPRGAESDNLRDILPGVFIPDDVVDFAYQINRRSTLDVSTKIEANRLCLWSAGEINLLVAPNAGVIGGNTGMLTPTRYVGLKVDVNSVPAGVIAPDLVAAVIHQLVAEAKQIAKTGLERFK